jgi:hypothetical protein
MAGEALSGTGEPNQQQDACASKGGIYLDNEKTAGSRIMNRAEKAMVEKNLDLLFEFERYIAEHPSSAARIPGDATVVL